MEMKKRALVSVSDKDGVVDFCKGLAENGFEIISTGGTAKVLQEAGLSVIGISEITGFPECLDGRVKTLHPNVHAGLLAMRSNPEHMAQLEELNINTIDIVCVNLYPFKATLTSGADFATCIENIDIGGPTMIRAAAKNYQDVAVIVDPADYDTVLAELKAGGVGLQTKKYLQYKVFAHTAVYDSLISNYLASQLGITFPDEVTFAYKKAQDMRYGENPQQQAVFYNEQIIRKGSLSSATQIWGKELSYNNINDANGALELLKEFGSVPAVVACKHANPCGVGTGENIYEAYMRAYNSDPVSVFGGILAINGIVDEATAIEINKIFIEIVIASGYDCKALEILESKKNIRLLQIDDISSRREPSAFDMKKVYGGLLVQQYDETLVNGEDLNLFRNQATVEVTTLADGKQKIAYGLGVVTERAPTEEEIESRKTHQIQRHCHRKARQDDGYRYGTDEQNLGGSAGNRSRGWKGERFGYGFRRVFPVLRLRRGVYKSGYNRDYSTGRLD